MKCITCGRDHEPPIPLCHEQWVIYSRPVGKNSVQLYPWGLGWTAWLRDAIIKKQKQAVKAEVTKYRMTKGSQLTPDKVKEAIHLCEGVIADAAKMLKVDYSYLDTFIGNYRLRDEVRRARYRAKVMHGKEYKGEHAPKEVLSITKEALMEALTQADGKVIRAAHRLGMSQSTIEDRIAKFFLREWLNQLRKNLRRRTRV